MMELNLSTNSLVPLFLGGVSQIFNFVFFKTIAKAGGNALNQKLLVSFLTSDGGRSEIFQNPVLGFDESPELQ